MSKKQASAADALRKAIATAEKRGVTRYQIAKLAGMPRSQLTRIAEGETVPRLDTAERIAAVIGARLIIVAK
ncbi:MAG TPA: helix-turn-helix transcriptional regulator [Tepidisphaeraceae bacterium]|nr:helix-turn-helix transcriptional regulator [Tepidisphaeraceae bacterium]